MDIVIGMDQLFWPRSAQDRIENMASIIRRIEGPARWCYPSQHTANLWRPDRSVWAEVDKCLTSIKPAGDFIETDPGYYIKRFYRGDLGEKICEVTLSTVYRDNRFVGSDCYYGLFLKKDDTAIGMTDDPFG